MTITTPDLTDYDVIMANSSGGKDSQAMLDFLSKLAADAGVSDRVVVVHADLGRMEWPGTLELARHQASLYGFRFEVVRNRSWGDLLDRVESPGRDGKRIKRWPDAGNRYCTKEMKTGQGYRVMTALVREHQHLGRQVRILNCLGMRAQESPKRRDMPAFEFDEPASNGKRHVDRWLPIHSWTVDEVWASIRASGVPHHPAYDQGMPRLSCSFCVLASKGALVRAAQLRPELAAEYAAVEERIGHRFTDALSMADIIKLAEANTTAAPIDDWAA